MAVRKRRPRFLAIRALPAVSAPGPVPSKPMAIIVTPRPRRPRRRPKPRALILSALRGAPSASYDEVVFRIGSLAAKWGFEMLTLRVSALSKARVEIAVSADKDGLPYNPTSAVAEMAFMTTSLAEPQPGDWKACNWDVTRIGTYVMQCLVGPGGTVSLGRGGYYVWARLTDSASNETPVKQVARMNVL